MGVLCECNIPLKFKENFYRTVIRVVLLYRHGILGNKETSFIKMSVANTYIASLDVW